MSVAMLSGFLAANIAAYSDPCPVAMDQACSFLFGGTCNACATQHQAALLAAGCTSVDIDVLCATPPLTVKRSVAHLSVARRDIGTVAVGGKAYFAGGCTDEGAGVTVQYVCDTACAHVDIFQKGVLVQTGTLTEPKGWVASCASGTDAVFVGGGTGGGVPHSRSADVISATGTSKSFPEALPIGRWGIGCATVNDTAFFIGGKVTIKGYSDAYLSNQINTYRDGKWSVAPFNLSNARESSTAVASSGQLLSAGGWLEPTNGGTFYADDSIDVFATPLDADTTTSVLHMTNAAFAMGAASADGAAFFVGDRELYVYNNSHLESVPLPPKIQGLGGSRDNGGAIPGAHIAQNGVTVGPLVCFYGLRPASAADAVYCYHLGIGGRWVEIHCTVPHKAGGFVATGNTIMVGGGFDPNSPNTAVTDVVDIFDITFS